MSTLYLVATPIGNLEDITARALSILKQVMVIAAEDTRHTRKLLSAYDIHSPLISYHEHNKLSQLGIILQDLEKGDVALVSDAGTPALNDPGVELIKAAIDAGHTISPIPGAAAPVAALIASGLPTDSFLYLGYLPRRKSERRALLQQVAPHPYTLIFLETPHRLLDALADLKAELGDRQVAAARELTKIHEEIIRGKISEILAHYQALEPRGEYTLVVAGFQPNPGHWDEAQLLEAIQESMPDGKSAGALARLLAVQSGWPRREVYQKIVALAKKGGYTI